MTQQIMGKLVAHWKVKCNPLALRHLYFLGLDFLAHYLANHTSIVCHSNRQTTMLKFLLESGADLYAINNVSKQVHRS